MPGRNTDVHSAFSIIQERGKDTFRDPVDPFPSPDRSHSCAHEREHERVCTLTTVNHLAEDLVGKEREREREGGCSGRKQQQWPD